jgi:DNA ligase 1
MEFETLYKRSETGAVITWDIWTEDNVICTRYGQDNGAMQESRREVYDGTNVGRSNERGPVEQAEFEAAALWRTKQEKGMYTTDISKIDSEIKIMFHGGIKPMKCMKYGDKLPKYPCYIQPKINGIRCIAVKDNTGTVKLYFSGGKEITTMEHIVKELEKVMPIYTIWDGELYTHGLELNEINGIVKANINMHSEDTRQYINFNVFDMIPDYNCISSWSEKFRDRFKPLALYNKDVESVRIVHTILVESKEDADRHYVRFVKKGYEGMIYRSANGPYEQKRSKWILKRKDFKDDEFLIIGCKYGKGKLEGLIVSFRCSCDGGEFDAPINGSYEYLAELTDDYRLWEGKFATVRYLELSEYGIPQIPKCIGIRESRGLD